MKLENVSALFENGTYTLVLQKDGETIYKDFGRGVGPALRVYDTQPELLRGAVQASGCAAVIAIDALAARSRDRLCATIQLGDTGLIPGSGVGNHRKAINARTLGVPVIAVGVPTVIAASLLGDDTAEDDPLFLTPRDIDEKVRELGRLMGYGITMALQEGLTVEDITGLLG